MLHAQPLRMSCSFLPGSFYLCHNQEGYTRTTDFKNTLLSCDPMIKKPLELPLQQEPPFHMQEGSDWSLEPCCRKIQHPSYSSKKKNGLHLPSLMQVHIIDGIDGFDNLTSRESGKCNC